MNKATNTTISFNATNDIKGRLQRIADSYGITISDLMRMSAVQIVNRGIAIEPSIEPSDYLLSAAKSAENDLQTGNTTSIASVDDLTSHLAGLRK